MLSWKLFSFVALSIAGLFQYVVRAEAESPGVTATEIRIGQTMPYSGPSSAYATIARVEAAYFRKINESGGIHGRKINFMSVDDAFNPAKTVEQTRRLVESDDVALIFNPLGTATSLSVRKYLNAKKVPQLFIGAGASVFGDPEHFPWTIGFQPNYQIEAGIYASHLLSTKPDAKVAVFTANDDAGRDYSEGFKKGLGSAASAMIVSEATYDSNDPTVDSKIVALKASKADTLFMHANPKQAAQAIRKVAELEWKPTFYIANVSSSVGGVLRPAGLENSVGLITAAWMKDSNDPQWYSDEGYKHWLEFMDNYYKDGDRLDSNNVYGYILAQALVHVLDRCGDDLSRDNIMKTATSLNFKPEMTLPGVTVRTTSTDYYPTRKEFLQRFDGKIWQVFGDAIEK